MVAPPAFKSARSPGSLTAPIFLEPSFIFRAGARWQSPSEVAALRAKRRLNRKFAALSFLLAKPQPSGRKNRFQFFPLKSATPSVASVGGADGRAAEGGISQALQNNRIAKKSKGHLVLLWRRRIYIGGIPTDASHAIGFLFKGAKVHWRWRIGATFQRGEKIEEYSLSM